MTFKIQVLTIGVNPIKRREYRAAGLPVVATLLPEVKLYGGLVATATDVDGFMTEIDKCLFAKDNQRIRRSYTMADETWGGKLASICQALCIEESIGAQ